MVVCRGFNSSIVLLGERYLMFRGIIVLHLQGQTVQEKWLYLLDPEEEGRPSQCWKPLTQREDITSHRVWILSLSSTPLCQWMYQCNHNTKWISVTDTNCWMHNHCRTLHKIYAAISGTIQYVSCEWQLWHFSPHPSNGTSPYFPYITVKDLVWIFLKWVLLMSWQQL